MGLLMVERYVKVWVVQGKMMDVELGIVVEYG